MPPNRLVPLTEGVQLWGREAGGVEVDVDQQPRILLRASGSWSVRMAVVLCQREMGEIWHRVQN